MEFGYFLSSEEHGPSELVDLAIKAEQAGFDEVWISDHFHPWTDRQGHASFVWSVLGAIMRETDLTVTTAVTCPTVRTHPAIVAHAAATVAVMGQRNGKGSGNGSGSGTRGHGRFRLGVGSGENLNEHILGEGWPETSVRLAMLEEAVEVIRTLWSGGLHSHYGEFFTLVNARIYDLPDEPPPIYVSAFGPQAAEVAGRIGDGIVTTSPDADTLAVFDKHGGAGKPRHAGTKVCWGPDEAEARRVAHELWASSSVPGALSQELPLPSHFQQATQIVTEDHVAAKTPCGPDPDRFVESFAQYRDAGIERLFVQQIGPLQDGFFEFFKSELRPRFT